MMQMIWRERVILIAVGISLATFSFCAFLEKYLPHRRPSAPDPVHGYTALVEGRFGQYFATSFEQAIASHIPLLVIGPWLIGLILSLWIVRAWLRQNLSTTRMPRVIGNKTILPAGAVTLLAYLLLWWTLP
jgi:hypothetical protein